jgi:hypothetical protein
MMALSTQTTEFPIRTAIESLRSAEVTGPLDDLTDALFQASGLLSRLRVQINAHDPRREEVSAIDESFSRAIALTRTLRERFLAPRLRGEYSSVSHAVRDVVGRLQGILPENILLTLSCQPGPTIVAADRADLRRAVVALIETGLCAVADGGTLALEVTERLSAPGEHGRRTIVLELHSSCAVDERDGRLETAVRPFVRALTGTIAFASSPEGGGVVAIRVPCSC